MTGPRVVPQAPIGAPAQVAELAGTAALGTAAPPSTAAWPVAARENGTSNAAAARLGKFGEYASAPHPRTDREAVTVS